MISTSQTVHYGEEESPVTSVRKRSSRLSMRKGRSIVHKNLEDNYGAVITANHEAIAQILEQVAKIFKKYLFLHCEIFPLRFVKTGRPLRACEASPLP